MIVGGGLPRSKSRGYPRFRCGFVIVRGIARNPDSPRDLPLDAYQDPASNRDQGPADRVGYSGDKMRAFQSLLAQPAGINAHNKRSPGLANGYIAPPERRVFLCGEGFQNPAGIQDGHG